MISRYFYLLCFSKYSDKMNDLKLGNHFNPGYALLKSFKPLVFIVICLVLFNSCAANKKRADFLFTKESYCNPPGNITASKPILINTDSVLTTKTELTEHFSDQSFLLLHAFGIYNEIKNLEQLQKDTSLNTRLKTLELRQQVDHKIRLTMSEIDAVSAELDCEGERIDQIANYADGIDSKRANRLTVASIIVGAASGIAAAFIGNQGWNKGVAVSSGVAGGGLGFLLLSPKSKKINLVHKQNLLRNIWIARNENEFPPFVWFVLTEKRFSNSGTSTLLNNLRQRWISYQFEGNTAKAEQSVNFSEGGIYKAADLHARAQMINQLQAVIRSINQNVNILLNELDKRKN